MRQSVCLCCPAVNTGFRTTCVLADHNGSLSAPQEGTYTATPSPASPVSLAREPSPSWLRARRRLAPGGAQVEGNFCLAYGGGTGQLPSVASLITLCRGERYRAGCRGAPWKRPFALLILQRSGTNLARQSWRCLGYSLSHVEGHGSLAAWPVLVGQWTAWGGMAGRRHGHCSQAHGAKRPQVQREGWSNVTCSWRDGRRGAGPLDCSQGFLL